MKTCLSLRNTSDYSNKSLKKVTKMTAAIAGLFALISCGSPTPTDQAKSATAIGEIQVKAVEPFEDCVGLDLATVTTKYVGGEWKIVDGPGGNHWAFSFGAEKAEAEKALKIIRAYRFAHSCFVSRPGPKMVYQLTAPGNSASAASHLVANEDCIPFNNAAVEAKWFPAPINSWKIVQGNMWMLDFGLDQAGVFKALRIIKLKRFNQQCFVGRPGPSFSYWKIKS